MNIFSKIIGLFIRPFLIKTTVEENEKNWLYPKVYPIDESIKILLPEKFCKDFYLGELIEYEREWKLKVIEKEDKIPIELLDKKVVLNWFRNPVEIVDYPLKWKPLYIEFNRRKWKEKGKDKKKSYSNTYEFHQPGMKATDDFAFFFKGLSRQERRKFFRVWSNIRYLR